MTMLKERVVLITGASGGLGRNVTEAFLGAGAKVAGVSSKIQGSDFPHTNFAAFRGDLSAAEGARGVVQAVAAKWERIDTLVHLVGGFAGGQTVAETDDVTLEKMLDMNLRSAFHSIRAVLPVMQAAGRGTILAIGSRTAVEPAATLGVYSASKAALVSLVRTVALENRDRGISANVILPGTMDTLANRAAMPDADPSKWVQPIQIARLLVHLASDDASQITGAVIPVFGREL
jgi:NAD(P)-dependent dehydrogenase (short-subunit alcohol dehydrogenase family)